MRKLLLIGVIACAGCVVPWRRGVLLRPEGAVAVRDARGGAPLVGAHVIVRRYRLGPPPGHESHRWTAVTDGAGQAAFGALIGHEWVMPLMMHGVPQWSWDVCVERPGYAPRVVPWMIQTRWSSDEQARDQLLLTVALAEGEGDCAHQHGW